MLANGQAASPGRFYSSLVIKLVLAHVLRGYECELHDYEKPQTFMWRSSILPRSDLTILLKPRSKGDELNISILYKVSPSEVYAILSSISVKAQATVVDSRPLKLSLLGLHVLHQFGRTCNI